METKILSADDSIKDLEYQLFQEIRAEVQKAYRTYATKCRDNC